MATARSEAASLKLLRRASTAGRYCSIPRRPAVANATLNHTGISGLTTRQQTRDFCGTPSPWNAPAASPKQLKRRSTPQPTTSTAVRRTSSGSKREIAVLGGGLTGLTAAHYLARHAPDAQITLFEAGQTLGGWVHGSIEDTPEGKVVMQQGPRMIRSAKFANRYDDLVFYDVLASLNIQDELKDVGEAASSRYLYYPDRLVRLPGPPFTAQNVVESIRSLLTEPLWDGGLQAAINFLRSHDGKTPKTAQTPQRLDEDESVGHFLERILGDDRPVKNIVSAMMHGIYGGDVYKLSAKHTIFGKMWYNDAGGANPFSAWTAYKELSLLSDIMDGPNRAAVIDMASAAVSRNMLSFDDGMLTLVRALEDDLKRFRNVKINMQTPVVSLSPDGSGQVQLKSRDSSGMVEKRFNKVISTITAKQLSKLAKPKGALAALGQTEAVTIQVVTLWYPEKGLLKNNPGFGYLVPISTPDNDAGILGVIFDSEAQTHNDEPGTKMTVMMGGHHWDGNVYFPTDEQAIEMAIQAVTKSLGIPRMPGMRTTTRLCRDCLPQHFVGHRKLMARAHDELLQTFHGGLAVAGPSYSPAGIMPAMRAGYEVAMRVAKQKAQPWLGDQRPVRERWWSMMPELSTRPGFDVFRHDHIGETGLEGFSRPEAEMVDLVASDALFFRVSTRNFSKLAMDDSGTPKQAIGLSLNPAKAQNRRS
ncbi:uncharacterized protein B0I36DRAFT_327198 [Microdochium trichocladiopsis]|uniref:protoporphyrinogen oxidase n=1 Tax=Microdochium trichocladiopsis TaxID=1682393 RepID=A0A9P9BKX6_9PEZI|nr:uncharacterized protein B0I36DRAFT_327198 [Microdochium trichocladiopsis]KAH7027487.1 hypothetical protein B0I36DRAFT_327198 [Microdochium trichocladiopsis]